MIYLFILIFFFFFFFFCVGFYHLHVISDWFSDTFPPKILHFCSLSDSKLQETNFKRLISQNQIFRKTVYKVLSTNSMNFGSQKCAPHNDTKNSFYLEYHLFPVLMECLTNVYW